MDVLNEIRQSKMQPAAQVLYCFSGPPNNRIWTAEISSMSGRKLQASAATKKLAAHACAQQVIEIDRNAAVATLPLEPTIAHEEKEVEVKNASSSLSLQDITITISTKCVLPQKVSKAYVYTTTNNDDAFCAAVCIERNHALFFYTMKDCLTFLQQCQEMVITYEGEWQKPKYRTNNAQNITKMLPYLNNAETNMEMLSTCASGWIFEACLYACMFYDHNEGLKFCE